MTVDRSLKLKSTLLRARSVLSRAERLAELKEAGKWRDGESVFGLPKVKVRRVKRRKAAKVEAAEAAPVAAGAPGAPAAAPAGAPAAKGAAAKAAPAGAPAAKGAAGKACSGGRSGCQRRRQGRARKRARRSSLDTIEFAAQARQPAIASLLFQRVVSGGYRMIADRMALLDSSGIRKVFDLAASMKNPINLSIGQPDFDVPGPVKDAAIEAIRRGATATPSRRASRSCTRRCGSGWPPRRASTRKRC